MAQDKMDIRKQKAKRKTFKQVRKGGLWEKFPNIKESTVKMKSECKSPLMKNPKTGKCELPSNILKAQKSVNPKMTPLQSKDTY